MSSHACRNCGAELTDRFCAHCGQTADVHVPSLQELLHETLEGFTHSDSRLWLTLQYLCVRPGLLTQEFVAGRRQTYLPPVRLYLVLSVIFFLCASFLHPTFKLIQFDAGEASLKTPAESCKSLNFSDAPAFARYQPKMQHACVAITDDNGAGLIHLMVSTMPKAMFVLLPGIAFLNMLLYWHPRHRYAEQLLFFLHLQSFYFAVLTLWALVGLAAERWQAIAGAADWLEALLLWSLPLYTLLAVRRYFQRGWVATACKSLVLFGLYIVLFASTVSIVFVYSALHL